MDRFLKIGDQVELEVEGIGTLTNYIVAPSEPSRLGNDFAGQIQQAGSQIIASQLRHIRARPCLAPPQLDNFSRLLDTPDARRCQSAPKHQAPVTTQLTISQI